MLDLSKVANFVPTTGGVSSYVNVDDTDVIRYCGSAVPARFKPFFMNAKRTAAVKGLLFCDSDLEFGWDWAARGVFFCVRPNNQQRGYRSGVYKDLSTARADCLLFLYCYGFETATANSLVQDASAAYQKMGKRGGKAGKAKKRVKK